MTALAVTPLGEVHVVPLATITPYERNPRKIPARAVEQVAKSLRDFGWKQPIIVDGDRVIVAGHVRYAAARSLGLTDAPVVVATDLSPEQVRAYRIADNRAHDYTTWDYSELVNELDGLGSEFSDVLDLTDWSALMTAFEAQNKATSHDLPPDDPANPVAGTGYTLSVEFASRDDADRAGPTLLGLPGVINVRHANR